MHIRYVQNIILGSVEKNKEIQDMVLFFIEPTKKFIRGKSYL